MFVTPNSLRPRHVGPVVVPDRYELISVSLGFIVTTNRTHPRSVFAESVAVRIKSVSSVFCTPLSVFKPSMNVLNVEDGLVGDGNVRVSLGTVISTN